MASHKASIDPVTGLTPFSPEPMLTKLGTDVKLENTPPSTPPAREIIDIRGSKELESLKNEIVSMFLDVKQEQRALPSLLLYDVEGLKLFEKVTYEKEYYLTGMEIGILTRWADNIAERIPDGWVLVELGSGNLRKISILLNALSRSKKQITYYALDVSLPELERTLSQIPVTVTDNITCLGLHGTYDDGLKWLSTDPQVKDKKKCIIWLGSSMGNFDGKEATAFLKNIKETAMGVGDMMLIGADGCKSGGRVTTAYNSANGASREFILNSLKHANNVLGHEVFSAQDWEYVGTWNAAEERLESYVYALKDLTIDKSKFGRNGTLDIIKGERLRVIRSHKFGVNECVQIWEGAGLVPWTKWGSGEGDYHLYLIYKPVPNFFPSSPKLFAKNDLPKDWLTG